jgi:hypothetical protein
VSKWQIPFDSFNALVDKVAEHTMLPIEDPSLAKGILSCAEIILANPCASQHNIAWWVDKLESFVYPLLQNSNPEYVATGEHCLCEFPSAIFEALEYKHSVYLIITLFAKCSDKTACVRAGAFRGLGTICAFAPFNTDDQFLSDLSASFAEGQAEKILSVKVRMGWALANLAQVLLHRATELDVDFNHSNLVSTSNIVDLVHIAIMLCGDHDRCRTSGVRALGALYPLLLKVSERSPTSSLANDVTEALVRNMNVGPFKTRWNTAIACGSFLSSSSLHITYQDVKTIKDSLVRELISSNNYKVRIHVVDALKYLIGPAESIRISYDDVLEVLRELLKVFDNLSFINDAQNLSYIREMVSSLFNSVNALLDQIGNLKGCEMIVVETLRAQNNQCNENCAHLHN